jgi:hypothetical protein
LRSGRRSTGAQSYFPTLFGRGGYAIVGNIHRLPAVLPVLYRQLTQQPKKDARQNSRASSIETTSREEGSLVLMARIQACRASPEFELAQTNRGLAFESRQTARL